MDRNDLNGSFVVYDLDNDELWSLHETEEEARSQASYMQAQITPPVKRPSFAVYRLELVD